MCVCVFWREVETILPTPYFRKVERPWCVSEANLLGMPSPCQDTESRRDRRKLFQIQTGDKAAVIEEPAELCLLRTTQPHPCPQLYKPRALLAAAFTCSLVMAWGQPCPHLFRSE